MSVHKKMCRSLRLSVSSILLILLAAAAVLVVPKAAIIAFCADGNTVIPIIQTDNFVYTDAQTGYGVYMEDNAALLTEEEKAELIVTYMQPITAYGNVGFVSTVTNNIYTERYAENRYSELFGTQSGTLFVVDMSQRVLAIWSDGDIYKTINSNIADTIMDNVYRKASGGNYFEMAKSTYQQILAKLKGQKIAQPMKYITNALFAVILALLINYMFVRRASSTARPGRSELLGALEMKEKVSGKHVEHRSTSKRYDPPSSSSSGGSSSRSGGGFSGGGGGGHSGGGGSHRF